jgi:metal-responsive CopG/Arc/MetJ family transcriptional regulator
MKAPLKKSRKARSPHWVRASISFPHDLYATFEALAKQKKVSLAWVVRDACEKYAAGEQHQSLREQGRE